MHPYNYALQFHCPQVEALGELSKLVMKTFSDGDVFNIYSSYVNNLAELQKNFKEEAESNQEFANFLKVFIILSHVSRIDFELCRRQAAILDQIWTGIRSA